MNIAMIAHDEKKIEMMKFATTYKDILIKHSIIATGTTGYANGVLQISNTGITGISTNQSNSLILSTSSTLNTTVANYISLVYSSPATTTSCTFLGGVLELVKS